MRTVLHLFTLIFVILFAAYVFAEIAISTGSNTGFESELRSLQQSILLLSREAWVFGKPFLQLIIILLVLEWFVKRLGFDLRAQDLSISWTFETLVAVIIIVAFCLSVLGGIHGYDALQDIVLVMVGFYFGSKVVESRSSKLEK